MSEYRIPEPPVLEQAPANAAPTSEFVSSTVQYSFLPFARALPQSIDDAERDFGLDIYERMDNDPILGSTTEALTILMLANGYRVVSPVSKPQAGEEEYENKLSKWQRAEEIRSGAEEMLRCCKPRFRSVLFDMCRSFIFGHRIAETVWDTAKSGKNKGRLVIEKLKVKPRRVYTFVLSPFNDLLGIHAKIPGVSNYIRTGPMFDLGKLPNVLDPSKFWIFTVGAIEGSPLGRSYYRRAYSPWYEKQLARPERLKFMVQWGGGMLTATLGENTPKTVEVVDSEGRTVVVPALTAVSMELSKLATNGGVAAFPYGTDFKQHIPNADGAAFGIINELDKEMVMAVMKQIRATMEAKHGSKADSSNSQDILDQVVNFLREELAESFHDLMRLYVARNWSEDDAHDFTPCLSFTTTAPADLASLLKALSSVGYRIGRSQVKGWDAMVNAPERSDEDIESADITTAAKETDDEPDTTGSDSSARQAMVH